MELALCLGLLALILTFIGATRHAMMTAAA